MKSERRNFHLQNQTNSDIDIAVYGLSDNEHTKANSKVMDLRTGFKIDLINVDLTKGLFRDKIQHQAIPIVKGVRNIYGTELKYDDTLTQAAAESIDELIADLSEDIKTFR